MAIQPIYGIVGEGKDKVFKGTPRKSSEESERRNYVKGYKKGVKSGIEESKEDELYCKFILSYGETLNYLKNILKLDYPNYYSRDFHIIYGQMLQMKKLVEYHELRISEGKIRREEKRKTEEEENG